MKMIDNGSKKEPSMELRCATFNVLADAYIGHGDYSHVAPALLEPGARTNGLVAAIDELNADVIGLQEVENPLVNALERTEKWQSFWTPKGNNKPDGCLMLIRRGIEVSDFRTHQYADEAGHILQSVRIGKAVFANTHIRWAPADDPRHVGVAQTAELLEHIGSEQPAVIFADINDRPNGPVRKLINEAGFKNVFGNEITAIVNQQAAALDVLAVRAVTAKAIRRKYDVFNIPSDENPSDHIPLLANVIV